MGTLVMPDLIKYITNINRLTKCSDRSYVIVECGDTKFVQ